MFQNGIRAQQGCSFWFSRFADSSLFCTGSVRSLDGCLAAGRGSEDENPGERIGNEKRSLFRSSSED